MGVSPQVSNTRLRRRAGPQLNAGRGMRFAVRGQGDPATLALVFRQIIDRLENTGVEDISQVSLYLTASIDGEELRVLNQFGLEEKGIVQMSFYGPEGGNHPSGKPLPPVAIVLPGDLIYFDLFTKFAVAVRIPRVTQCELLGMSNERFVKLTSNLTDFELSVEERRRMTILGEMVEAANELADDWKDATAWFQGNGSTPRGPKTLPSGGPENGSTPSCPKTYLKVDQFNGGGSIILTWCHKDK